MDNKLKDLAHAVIDGHVLIKDYDTGEVLLDKHNSINLINIAVAIASLLGGAVDTDSQEGFNVVKMVFGNRGTTINSQGNIEYKTPNTDTATGTLYNQTYYKMVDGTDSRNPNDNNVEIRKYDGQVYSDVVVTATLQYDDPDNDPNNTDGPQDTVDDGSVGGTYTFDEIGLITAADTYISHIVFHPIQKSANRKVQIIYTLRIRAGS